MTVAVMVLQSIVLNGTVQMVLKSIVAYGSWGMVLESIVAYGILHLAGVGEGLSGLGHTCSFVLQYLLLCASMK